MPGVLELLGKTVMPQVFGALNIAGLNYLMDVVEEAKTQGTGGGQIKPTPTVAYENIPAAYKSVRLPQRDAQTGKMVSVTAYKLTFPVYHESVRINIDPKVHRLKFQETDSEPEKIFKIIGSPDVMGVVYEVIAEKEN